MRTRKFGPRLGGQFAQPPLGQERKPHGVRRFGENDEERIAGGGDFLGVGEFGQERADQGVVARQQRRRGQLAHLISQGRRALDVGEEEGEHRGAMALAKLLDRLALVIRDLQFGIHFRGFPLCRRVPLWDWPPKVEGADAQVKEDVGNAYFGV